MKVDGKPALVDSKRATVKQIRTSLDEVSKFRTGEMKRPSWLTEEEEDSLNSMFFEIYPDQNGHVDWTSQRPPKIPKLSTVTSNKPKEKGKKQHKTTSYSQSSKKSSTNKSRKTNKFAIRPYPDTVIPKSNTNEEHQFLVPKAKNEKNKQKNSMSNFKSNKTIDCNTQKSVSESESNLTNNNDKQKLLKAMTKEFKLSTDLTLENTEENKMIKTENVHSNDLINHKEVSSIKIDMQHIDENKKEANVASLQSENSILDKNLQTMEVSNNSILDKNLQTMEVSKSEKSILDKNLQTMEVSTDAQKSLNYSDLKPNSKEQKLLIQDVSLENESLAKCKALLKLKLNETTTLEDRKSNENYTKVINKTKEINNISEKKSTDVNLSLHKNTQESNEKDNILNFDNGGDVNDINKQSTNLQDSNSQVNYHDKKLEKSNIDDEKNTFEKNTSKITQESTIDYRPNISQESQMKIKKIQAEILSLDNELEQIEREIFKEDTIPTEKLESKHIKLELKRKLSPTKDLQLKKLRSNIPIRQQVSTDTSKSDCTITKTASRSKNITLEKEKKHTRYPKRSLPKVDYTDNPFNDECIFEDNSQEMHILTPESSNVKLTTCKNQNTLTQKLPTSEIVNTSTQKLPVTQSKNKLAQNLPTSTPKSNILDVSNQKMLIGTNEKINTVKVCIAISTCVNNCCKAITSSEKMKLCDHCNINFPTYILFLNHMKQVHNNNVTPRFFYSVSSVNWYINHAFNKSNQRNCSSCVINNIQKLICHYCGKIYSDFQILAAHMKIIHKTVPILIGPEQTETLMKYQPSKCLKCGIDINKFEDYASHMLKEHQCHLTYNCYHYKFPCRKAKNKQENDAIQDTNILCHLCPKYFKNHIDFMNHIIENHSNNIACNIIKVNKSSNSSNKTQILSDKVVETTKESIIDNKSDNSNMIISSMTDNKSENPIVSPNLQVVSESKTTKLDKVVETTKKSITDNKSDNSNMIISSTTDNKSENPVSPNLQVVGEPKTKKLKVDNDSVQPKSMTENDCNNSPSFANLESIKHPSEAAKLIHSKTESPKAVTKPKDIANTDTKVQTVTKVKTKTDSPKFVNKKAYMTCPHCMSFRVSNSDSLIRHINVVHAKAKRSK